MKKVLGFLLGVFIGLCVMLPIINQKKEIAKLKKENDKLQEEIVEYKWQLEQVPYILEYGCSE